MIRARQAIGLLGLLVALAGLATDSAVIVWVAIGLLGASILLRAIAAIAARRQAPSTTDEGSLPG